MVAEAVSFLRLLADPDDSVALYQYLTTVSTPAIAATDLQAITRRATSQRIPLWEAAEMAIRNNDEDESQCQLREALRLVEKDRRDSLTQPALSLLIRHLKRSGSLDRLSEPASVSEARSGAKLGTFFEILKDLEVQSDTFRGARRPAGMKAAFLLPELERLIESGGLHVADRSLEALTGYASAGTTTPRCEVHVGSIHSAKGLEFDAVFLVGLFPPRSLLCSSLQLILAHFRHLAS